MNNSKVSIIIPVYNAGKYLYQCLDSIVNQTYENLEIIIVDDGSTDDSSKICDKYAQNDSRIKVVHKENEGVSKARNTGIEMATGDYYYFPDSDDYIETDTIDYLIKLIQLKKCEVVNFEYYITYSDGREIKHQVDSNLYGFFDTKNSHGVVMSGEPFAWNKFFTKKAVEGISFNETICRGEDSLFVHECIEQIDFMWFDKKPLYHYVQSEESACRGKFRKSQMTLLKLYDEYKSLYQEKYPQLWYIFVPNLMDLMIGLYFDMYVDNENLLEEKKRLISEFKKRYSEIKKFTNLSKKRKIKFLLFHISPNAFCKIHKVINKL